MSPAWLRRRPLVASLLAFVYPGLGHLYLRAWLRAIAWFGLALITALMVIPESTVTAFRTGGVSALYEASQTLPLEATLSLLVVRVLNVIDAYLTGLRDEREATRTGPEGETCPECGRELDPDLDFCPWCTTRLAEVDEEEDDPDPTMPP